MYFSKFINLIDLDEADVETDDETFITLFYLMIIQMWDNGYKNKGGRCLFGLIGVVQSLIQTF
ncbi:hypothetical protein VCHA53O466_50493 [Vibrio chagasii]|nr:hypothetical protein VCHA53O466_50493 [Vibrio chagasii]